MSDAQNIQNNGAPGGTREENMSALFAQMVIQQANMAMMLMGQVPHPQTGQTIKDIEAARMFIDQLEMLEEKTKGNLSKHEENLLRQSVTTLQMAFVEAVESREKPAASQTAPAAEPARETQPPQSSGETISSPAPEEESKKKFSKKY
ncbi:MAG TPA: DUF1844 domain-containing protein [Verrucomicrobiae bacterium]|jgi:hypothetical protein|nr:DUF1844 domain-containing protein [Verrucomicrobiae bacterium]